MAIQESFLHEILGIASIGRTSEQSTLYKNRIFHQFVKVSSLKVFCLGSNRIIEGSCVNSSGIVASIYVLECTRQFECYKYTLYIGMQYSTRFRSNTKISSTIIKIQYTQL